MSTTVALISDSHGHIDDSALTHLEDVDEIWHAGDIGEEQVIERLPKHAIHRIITGNIDHRLMRLAYPEELHFEIEGTKIFMIHIGGSPGRYAKGVKAKILELKPDLFVCGHSHICKVVYDKSLQCLYMNPGAVGNHGFHQVKTLLKFSLEEGKIKDLRVIELGKRGRYPDLIG